MALPLLVLLLIVVGANDNVMWHISTPAEGLLSHFFQILRLRAGLRNAHQIHGSEPKSIIETAFYRSPHFPDVHVVNICRVFVMPPDVTCSEVPLLKVVHQFNCHANNKTGFSYRPQEYNLPPNSFSNLSFSDVPWYLLDCIVGYIPHSFPGHQRWDVKYHGFDFQKPYKHTLFPLARSILTANNTTKYAVLHWRRGDLLDTRCKPHHAAGHDHSINCAHSATDFVVFAKSVCRKHIPKEEHDHLRIYVATNEVNQTELLTLHNAGLMLYSDIRSRLSQHLAAIMKQNVSYLNISHSNSSNLVNLTSVDAFAIELMLMCDADYFFAWGMSNTHDFTRIFCSSPLKQRFIDAK